MRWGAASEKIINLTNESAIRVAVVGVGSFGRNHARVYQQLAKQGGSDVLVVVGGVIPAQDYDFLKKAGVAAIYGPGTNIPAAAAISAVASAGIAMAAMTATIAESISAAIDRTTGKITPAIGYASPAFAQFLAPGMIDESASD